MHLVHEYIKESAHRFPDKPALVCELEEFSYEQMQKGIESLVKVLAETGLRRGDRVLILLNHKVHFLLACYSSMAAGAIAVPLIEGISRSSIEIIAEDCSPSLLISSSNDLDLYPQLRELMTCTIVLIDKDETSAIREQNLQIVGKAVKGLSHANGPNEKNVSKDDGAVILYTSGSTGRKKGVLLTHRNLIRATLNINEYMGIDSRIREFVAVSLAHSFGFGRSRCVLFVGGTLVMNDGMLNPPLVVQTIERHKCNAISTVPSGFALFFGRLEPLLWRVGSQIRHIELGSSPMSIEGKKKIMEIFPNARICMHYGLTEASRSTFIEFRHERTKLETVGRPSPNVEIRIAPDDQQLKGDDVEGEILIHGDHVASRYWNNEALTKEKFIGDGWLKTGDYGSIDRDGYVCLLGRKDDMINTGGIKISPLEIEEQVRHVFPHCECCVVGIPDPAGVAGEIPVLCYKAENGMRMTSPELIHVLQDKIDKYKVPRMVFQPEKFPKTENGKIKRDELRHMILKDMLHRQSEPV
ncbi:MAG: acyl--CoA ligase [Ignavibacteriales bacterium]|nr:acyl--CoA ligase [Ignavibacteriales bacterium]